MLKHQARSVVSFWNVNFLHFASFGRCVFVRCETVLPFCHLKMSKRGKMKQWQPHALCNFFRTQSQLGKYCGFFLWKQFFKCRGKNWRQTLPRKQLYQQWQKETRLCLCQLNWAEENESISLAGCHIGCFSCSRAFTERQCKPSFATRVLLISGQDLNHAFPWPFEMDRPCQRAFSSSTGEKTAINIRHLFAAN